MNVLQITPVAPPHRSGMAVAAGEIARAVSVVGAAVTLVSPIGGGAVRGVSVPRLASLRVPGAGFLAFTPGLPGLIRRGGFDVIHLHYPCFGNASLVHLALAAGARTPLVVSYHMDVVGRGLRRIPFAYHAAVSAPRLLRRAARIAVASRDYADHSLLARHPELMRKLVEIPFGMDAVRFSPGSGEAVRRTHAIAPDRPVILFVGGLDEQHYFKGLEVLMRALVRVPRAVLLVVGSGGLLKRYARRAHGLGVDERVIFAGRVSDAELPVYYRAAHLLCLPSLDRSEAYGLVIAEAAATGIPAVASDLPGVRSAMVAGETGILAAPGDVDALAAAIHSLIRDPANLKRMGDAARRLAHTRSWKASGERYVALYREVLGSRA